MDVGTDANCNCDARHVVDTPTKNCRAWSNFKKTRWSLAIIISVCCWRGRLRQSWLDHTEVRHGKGRSLLIGESSSCLLSASERQTASVQHLHHPPTKQIKLKQFCPRAYHRYMQRIFSCCNCHILTTTTRPVLTRARGRGPDGVPTPRDSRCLQVSSRPKLISSRSDRPRNENFGCLCKSFLSCVSILSLSRVNNGDRHKIML